MPKAAAQNSRQDHPLAICIALAAMAQCAAIQVNQLQTALQLDPNSEAARYNLELALTEKGKPQK